MSRAQFLTTTAIAFGALALVGAVGYARAEAADSAAAEAPTASVGEVVVTARNRTEKLVDVPISIQTFSSTQIRTNGIVDLNDLQFQAGFTFQQGVSTQGNGREFPGLIFRGMQTTYGAGSGDSGALFVDGVYISGGAASVTTADVDHIEVLKGPQNVFFGKNTFGGAINFITANPKDEFGGSAEASISGLGSSTDILMVEGPIIKGVLDGRLTAEDYTKGAQYHASDGGALGAENTKSITGTLYATPTPGLWLRFRGHYQQDDDSAADTGFLPGDAYGSNCPTGTGRGTNVAGQPTPFTLTGPYFCGSIPSLGQVGTSVLDQNTVVPAAFAKSLATNVFNEGPPFSDPFLTKVPKLNHSGLRRDLIELSLQGGYDLPYNAKLAINAGYNQSGSLDIWDLDRSPNELYINAQPIITHDYEVDGRIISDQSKKLRGLIGASYFQSVYQSTQYDDNFYGPSSGFLYAYYGGTSVQTGNLQNEEDETTAVFGSVDFDLFPWLTGTAEGRYQTDTLSDITSSGGSVKESFNTFLPRYIVKFHPRADWNFYVSYSEGVQPAVLNSSYANATPAQQAYLASVVPGASDYAPLAKLHAWEIGAKQSLFGGRIHYGIAGYVDKWIDQETSTAIFNPAACGQAIGNTPSCPLPTYGAALYLANQATIKGIEFSGSAVITPNLTFDLSVDYTHAKWNSYQNNTYSAFTGGIGYYDGNTISRVPDWQGSASLTYQNHLIADWDWFAHGLVYFQGGMYESEINLAESNPYARVNMEIGVRKGNLTLQFYAKNLLNDKNWDWVSRVPSLNSPFDNFTTDEGVLVQAPDRQDFGVKLSAKF
jgi:iron complex outermembrane receptor protein